MASEAGRACAVWVEEAIGAAVVSGVVVRAVQGIRAVLCAASCCFVFERNCCGGL